MNSLILPETELRVKNLHNQNQNQVIHLFPDLQSGCGGVLPEGGGVLWWSDIPYLSPFLSLSHYWLLSWSPFFVVPFFFFLWPIVCAHATVGHTCFFFFLLQSEASNFCLPPLVCPDPPWLAGIELRPLLPLCLSCCSSSSFSLADALVLFCMLPIDWRSRDWQTVLSV